MPGSTIYYPQKRDRDGAGAGVATKGRLRQSLSSSRGQLEQLINGNTKQVKRMKLYLFRLRTNVSEGEREGRGGLQSYESNFSFLINRPTKGCPPPPERATCI